MVFILAILFNDGDVMADGRFMRMAIDKALEGIRNGQLPFGACIERGGEVISCEHNTILKERDVTAHAEVNAIKEACKKLDTLDLSGCTAYCTCEPCPMCLGALSLANIKKVVYGARIHDVGLIGYTVIDTPPALFSILGFVEVDAGFLMEENLKILREWERHRMH